MTENTTRDWLLTDGRNSTRGPVRFSFCAIRFLFAVAMIIAPVVLGGDESFWTSRLYPGDWKPGSGDEDGRFLQDYSYAGYRRGEKPLPALNNTAVYDIVREFRADNTGERDSFGAFHAAIEKAVEQQGGIIYVPGGIYRISRALTIRGSNILLAGEGAEKTRLYFSSAPGDTAVILFAGTPEIGREYPFVEDGTTFGTRLLLEAVDGIQPGDDIEIGFVISDDFLKAHGMEADWRFARNEWRTFFRRQVVSVEPASSSVVIDVPLRYPVRVADRASLRVVSGLLRECGIRNLSVATAGDWERAWKTTRSCAVTMVHCRDCWMENVHSFPSPSSKPGGYHLLSGGIRIHASSRITIAGCVLQRPQNRGPGGNGHLFEVSESSEILFRDCEGLHGRHNFFQFREFNTNGCVFLRVTSRGGKQFFGRWDPLGLNSFSGFGGFLSMANLVDQSVVDDGWSAINRQATRDPTGHSSTQNVFWNILGTGTLHSAQFGWGYVIGTGPKLNVNVSDGLIVSGNSLPIDYTEGLGLAATLRPASLYEEQLRRRLSSLAASAVPVSVVPAATIPDGAPIQSGHGSPVSGTEAVSPPPVAGTAKSGTHNGRGAPQAEADSSMPLAVPPPKLEPPTP